MTPGNAEDRASFGTIADACMHVSDGLSAVVAALHAFTEHGPSNVPIYDGDSLTSTGHTLLAGTGKIVAEVSETVWRVWVEDLGSVQGRGLGNEVWRVAHHAGGALIGISGTIAALLEQWHRSDVLIGGPTGDRDRATLYELHDLAQYQLETAVELYERVQAADEEVAP